MNIAEWIKSIFDVVRNYGLSAAVALFGNSLWNSTSSSGSGFYLFVSWALIVIGYLLFLLNIYYSALVLRKSPFLGERRDRVAWTVVTIAIAVLLGCLLAGAAISYQVAARAR